MPYALAVADLHRDGHPDFLVGYVEAPSAAFFGNARARRFTRVPFGDSLGAVYGFAVADLDGDGYPDIAAARSEARTWSISATLGNRALIETLRPPSPA